MEHLRDHLEEHLKDPLQQQPKEAAQGATLEATNTIRTQPKTAHSEGLSPSFPPYPLATVTTTADRLIGPVTKN